MLCGENEKDKVATHITIPTKYIPVMVSVTTFLSSWHVHFYPLLFILMEWMEHSNLKRDSETYRLCDGLHTSVPCHVSPTASGSLKIPEVSISIYSHPAWVAISLRDVFVQLLKWMYYMSMTYARRKKARGFWRETSFNVDRFIFSLVSENGELSSMFSSYFSSC